MAEDRPNPAGFARWRQERAELRQRRAESHRYNRDLRATRRRNLNDSRKRPTRERLDDEIAWRAQHGLEATESAAWAARKDRRGERCRHGGAWLRQAELARYELLLARSGVPPVEVAAVLSPAELETDYAGAWFHWTPAAGAWRFGFTRDIDAYLARLQAAVERAAAEGPGRGEAQRAGADDPKDWDDHREPTPVAVFTASRSLRELETAARAIREDAGALAAELAAGWIGARPDIPANGIVIEVEHLRPEHVPVLLARYGPGVTVRQAPPLR